MDTQPGPTQGKQVPAAFPDYTSVIPRSGTTDYLDTDHVRQALDHADTLMRGTGTGAVTIERKNGEVLLTAHNRDSAHGPVTVKLGDTQHPDGKVAVKASYLRDTLTGAKGGTFGLTTNESLSPMLVERHDGERHVVMPMRL
jgi:DNA polymerase III sliding clamp (beta) subunit (PCNA family)